MYVYRKEVIDTMVFSDEEIEKIRAQKAEDCEVKIEEFTDDDLLEYFDDLDLEDICAIYHIPFNKMHSHIDSRFIKLGPCFIKKEREVTKDE